jgi:hypothetical protein
MGKILSTKVLPNQQMKIKICVEQREALALQGSVRKIHLFARDLCEVESEVIERGKKGVTKYFLIPSKLRSKSKRKPCIVCCQRIDGDTKVMFVYTIEKEQRLI